MLQLNLETGVQEISLNGKVSVFLNLTDIDFVERIFNAFDDMEQKQEKYQKMLDGQDDARVLFKTAREMDAEMRETINGLFGLDVCTPLFGTMNVYARADGLPLWVNLIMAIIEQMDDTVTAEKKKQNPKLQKYLAKLDKKK